MHELRSQNCADSMFPMSINYCRNVHEVSVECWLFHAKQLDPRNGKKMLFGTHLVSGSDILMTYLSNTIHCYREVPHMSVIKSRLLIAHCRCPQLQYGISPSACPSETVRISTMVCWAYFSMSWSSIFLAPDGFGKTFKIDNTVQ